MSQIQQIKDRLDVVEIIGERVQLQRSGKNFRGLCPFHSEKTPSFFVSPELQNFKCFGCGKQGDVFEFVQEYERLTFREALEQLAKRAGVELETELRDPNEKLRREVFAVLDLAKRYYHYLLTEHKLGEPGRNYLEQRQLSNSVANNFELGLAPDGWDHLTNYLQHKKKFSTEVLLAAGLVIQGQHGRIYDRFRGRLMFPLSDHRGRVVGFSGRLLDANAKEAKYINTAETLVYHKRELLFGYHQNLAAIREKEAVIIVEGEFDVLSSVQAHVKHIVAIKGSALTEEQVRLLSRTVKTIYLCLDADSAGIEATKRAIELIQGFNSTLRIIPLTGGKDPDDLASNNPKAWREMSKQNVAAFDYLLEHVVAQHDLDSVLGQREVADEMLQVILKIEHPVERNFYLQKLGQKLQQSTHVLEEQLDKLQRQKRLPQRAVEKVKDETNGSSKEDLLGWLLWQLAWQSNNVEQKVPLLVEVDYQSELLIKLKSALQKYINSSATITLSNFAIALEPQQQETLTKLYLQTQDSQLENLEEMWQKTWQQIKQRQIKNRLAEIKTQLNKLEQLNDLNAQQQLEYDQLLQESANLTSSLQK